MPPNPPLLEARHIARRDPDSQQWLLDDVSLEIAPGERLAVVGPSGSGKTLLLRALALLDPFDRGEVRWRDRPVRRDEIPAFRRQALYLHQRPALLEETVEAALRRPFSLRSHRAGQFDRDRVLHWLGQLERDGSFLDKRARDLSGGEIQITSLLRAIQLDPALLLLDEPTAALDARTTSNTEQLVERWVEESPGARAFVWVSHDADQARRVARRTLRVDGGRVVGSG